MDHTENLYKNIDKKRWIGLISSLLVMITISYSYTWSLMVNPMIEERGASLSSMALLYTILNIGYSFLMMVGGKISDKIGVRKMFIIAVVCYAIGFALCGLWTTFWGFTIGTLVFINIQNGFGYIAAFSCVGRLFPDKKGLCMALIGMGTTGGGMVISPVTQYFIDTIGFSGQFLAMGAILTVIGVIAVILCVPAPDGYVPAGYSFEDEEKKQEEGITLNQKFVQKDWKMMIKDPAFYLFALSTIFGASEA